MLSYKYLFFICIFTLFLPSFGLLQDCVLSTIPVPESDTDSYQNQINMILYKGPSLKASKMVMFPLSQISSFKDQLNFNQPIALYIHGFAEHYSNKTIQTIVSAYLEKGQDNILVLDWSGYSYGNYTLLIKLMDIIAMNVGQALEGLVKIGMNSENLSIVGHSMGAQLASFIGKHIKFTIPRITALDPAMPLFYDGNTEHITSKSARQVVVIHTDGGNLGALADTGSIDFYANGGIRPQPGCGAKGAFLYLCHHQRSVYLYAESLSNEQAFPALQCQTNNDFIQDKCKGNKVAYFGYAKIPQISGRFYFTTNGQSPFGKGNNGIQNPIDKSIMDKLVNQ